MFRVNNSNVGIARLLNNSPVTFYAYYIDRQVQYSVQSDEFNNTVEYSNALRELVNELISKLSLLYSNDFKYNSETNYRTDSYPDVEYKYIFL